jgi:hypothetical protein
MVVSFAKIGLLKKNNTSTNKHFNFSILWVLKFHSNIL